MTSPRIVHPTGNLGTSSVPTVGLSAPSNQSPAVQEALAKLGTLLGLPPGQLDTKKIQPYLKMIPTTQFWMKLLELFQELGSPKDLVKPVVVVLNALTPEQKGMICQLFKKGLEEKGELPVIREQLAGLLQMGGLIQHGFPFELSEKQNSLVLSFLDELIANKDGFDQVVKFLNSLDNHQRSTLQNLIYNQSGLPEGLEDFRGDVQPYQPYLKVLNTISQKQIEILGKLFMTALKSKKTIQKKLLTISISLLESTDKSQRDFLNNLYLKFYTKIIDKMFEEGEISSKAFLKIGKKYSQKIPFFNEKSNDFFLCTGQKTFYA